MNARGEQTRSLWMKVEVYPDAPKFSGKKSCDTVIIGSGIAGLSVAYELASIGQKVIVIDRGPIAGGMTSRTTAHLAPICDDGLSALINLRGEETARLFQESQEAAVARIEQNVAEFGIDCNFRRLDAFLFPAMGVESKGSPRSAPAGIRCGTKGRGGCRARDRCAAQRVSRRRLFSVIPTRPPSIRCDISAASQQRSATKAAASSPTAPSVSVEELPDGGVRVSTEMAA